MIARFALFFAAFGMSSLARAQVVASDDFGYSGALSANGWASHSGTGNKTVLANGSVATLNQSAGSGEDVSLVFPAFGATDEVFASFTLNVPSGNPVNPAAAGLYFAHFKNATTNFRARTGLLSPAAGGDYRLALNADNANLGAGVAWASDLLFDTDYLVIISWNAATGQSRLWLDPTSIASTNLSHTGIFTADLITGFALRQSSEYTGFINVDDVVVGHTFGDVFPDSTPPTLSCPGAVTAMAPRSTSRVVFFTVTATDDLDPAPSVVCTPPSGSTFPTGTTVVTCTATDAAGNQSVCTFPVTVLSLVRSRGL